MSALLKVLTDVEQIGHFSLSEMHKNEVFKHNIIHHRTDICI